MTQNQQSLPCDRLPEHLASLCCGDNPKFSQRHCVGHINAWLVQNGLPKLEKLPVTTIIPSPRPIVPGMNMGLGDRISQALSIVGITEERVTAWIGKPCGCSERQEKLNRVGRWASRVLQGSFEKAVEGMNKAKQYLEEILTEKEQGNP